MKAYYFYDSDWNFGGKGDAEYHIQGEEFRRLLEVCFRYSTHVAFAFSPQCDKKYQQLFSPFEVAIPAVISPKTYPLMEYTAEELRLRKERTKCFVNRGYCTCPELLDLLCSVSDSIFTYLDGRGYFNPENPTFYRADGSVFFSSVIHEGECKMTPRDGEDVSAITSNPLWVSCNE